MIRRRDPIGTVERDGVVVSSPARGSLMPGELRVAPAIGIGDNARVKYAHQAIEDEQAFLSGSGSFFRLRRRVGEVAQRPGPADHVLVGDKGTAGAR